MNLYSSEVICNSTEGSTLVNFLHSIVERRVTSFESRAIEWRASATLHLSGTVFATYAIHRIPKWHTVNYMCYTCDVNCIGTIHIFVVLASCMLVKNSIPIAMHEPYKSDDISCNKLIF